MLTFLAGREAAGGFHVIWPVQDPKRDDKIIADLEARKPGTIIYSLSQYAHLGSFRRNAGKLFDYLVDRYEIAKVFSREPHGPLVTALKRRDAGFSSGESLLDLLPEGGDLRAVRWPFAAVMTQPVGKDGTTSAARVPLKVPALGARLDFSYGVNPDRWLGLNAGPFVFKVGIEPRSPRGERATLFEARIDPARDVEDRRWTPAQIELGAYAGQEVDLVFAIDAERMPADPLDLAGFAEPRLVAESASPPRSARRDAG
jgi:hypothetical protein